MNVSGPRAGRFSYRRCGAWPLPARGRDAQIEGTAGPVSLHATPTSQSGRQPEST